MELNWEWTENKSEKTNEQQDPQSNQPKFKQEATGLGGKCPQETSKFMQHMKLVKSWKFWSHR